MWRSCNLHVSSDDAFVKLRFVPRCSACSLPFSDKINFVLNSIQTVFLLKQPICNEGITVQWSGSSCDNLLIVCGFPENMIHEQKLKLITNKTKVTQTDPPQKQSNKCATFTFHGTPVHKITNLFRNTGLKIAFRPTNTIFQQLTHKKTVTPAEYINLNVTHAIKLTLDNPVEQCL